MPRFKLQVKQATVKFTREDSHLPSAQFIAERFRSWAPTHQTSIISGSSSLYFNPPELGEHIVCDAAAIQAVDPESLKDEPLHFSFAVTDGLGYDLKDSNYNKSLGLVAGTASEYFIKNSKEFLNNPVKFLKEAASFSKKYSLKNKDKESYESECSLSGGHFYFDGQRWKGLFTNIGDGMIVVLDGATHRVKNIIPARSDRRFMGAYSPQSLQELLTKEVNIALTESILEEGDIIVAMTDGVYGNYSLSVEQGAVLAGDKDPQFLQTRIKPASIEAALAPLRAENYPSAFEIAKCLIQTGMVHHQRDYRETYNLYKALEEYLNDKQEPFLLTKLDDFLTILRTDNPPFREALERHLLQEGSHDGVVFRLDKARITDLMDLLNKQEFGDCTTAGVMRVPYYADELVKLLIEDPSYAKALAPEIKKHVTEAKLPVILARLSKEIVSPGPLNHPGYKLGEEPLQYRYSPKDLDDVRMLIGKITGDMSLPSLMFSLKHLSIQCSHLMSSENISAHGDLVKAPLIHSPPPAAAAAAASLDLSHSDPQKEKLRNGK